MAEHSIAIRFGIENGAVVLRDLKAIGGNGEKALKRIEQAGKPASRALQGVSAVAQDLRGRFENMASGLGPLGAGLMRLGPIGWGVAGGIGAVVLGLTKLVSKGAEVIEQLDSLDDTAQRLGIDAEKFQALKFGFHLTGVKPEQLETSLMRLNDMIGDVLIQGKDVPKETKLAFGKLGITFDEVKKHGDDLPWMINSIAEGVRKLPTVAEKTNVLRSLFGKQGAQMLPLLDQGTEGIAKFTEMAIRMGAVVPKEMVAAGSETNDQIGAINQAIDGQWARLTAGFGEWNKDFKLGLWQILKWTADWKDKLDKQSAADWATTKRQAAAAWEGLKSAWASVIGALGDAWSALTFGLGAAWEGVTSAIAGVWDAVASRLGKAWQASLARNKKAWEEMVAGLEKVCPGAVAAIESAWDSLKEYWGRLTDALGSAWDALTGRLGEKWRRFIDGLPVPGAVKRWLGMDAGAPAQSGATGTIPPPGATVPTPPLSQTLPPGATISPPGPGKTGPTGATGTIPPMPKTPAGVRGSVPAVRRAAPASAPPARSARPQRHAALDIGGGVDINIRGPGEVRRVRTRDPRVPISVNQGWSRVG